MTPPDPPYLFISYARGDDEPFVERLHRDLTANGYAVWWDRTAMESRGRTFLQEIRDAIEGSERVIAVIGLQALRSDYVRMEWEHALLFCKAVIPVLRIGDYDTVPAELCMGDYWSVPVDLRKFHVPNFRAERPYEEALQELLRLLATPVPPLAPFLTEVPSLPPHFLPRRGELAGLAKSVLADIHRPTVITSARQTTALQGMGGVGKSVLAAAFARRRYAPCLRRRHRLADGWGQPRDVVPWNLKEWQSCGAARAFRRWLD